MHLLPALTWEDSTSVYAFQLVDEFGEAIDSAIITAMSLTYYAMDLTTRARTIINGRDEQDVLQTNDVSMVTDVGPPMRTVVQWVMQPADLVQIFPAEYWEVHEARWEWTWAQGARHGVHKVAFGVQAL